MLQQSVRHPINLKIVSSSNTRMTTKMSSPRIRISLKTRSSLLEKILTSSLIRGASSVKTPGVVWDQTEKSAWAKMTIGMKKIMLLLRV